MSVKKIIFGVITGFALIGNTYAANKTRITDVLGAGNSKLGVSYAVNYIKMDALFNVNIILYTANADYSLGITDRLDIAINAPFFQGYKATSEYTFGGNQYKNTIKSEGPADLQLRAQYLILDKQQDQVDWMIMGSYSPSTAPSTEPTAEVVTNGNVTTPGTTGKSGRGYAIKAFSSALAIPSTQGDVVMTATYIPGSEGITTEGIAYKSYASKHFDLYLEHMLSEHTMLTPHIGFARTAISPPRDYYTLGFNLTHDVSDTFSIMAGASYMKSNYSSDAGIISDSYSAYGLSVSTLFFF